MIYSDSCGKNKQCTWSLCLRLHFTQSKLTVKYLFIFSRLARSWSQQQYLNPRKRIFSQLRVAVMHIRRTIYLDTLLEASFIHVKLTVNTWVFEADWKGTFVPLSTSKSVIKQWNQSAIINRLLVK